MDFWLSSRYSPEGQTQSPVFAVLPAVVETYSVRPVAHVVHSVAEPVQVRHYPAHGLHSLFASVYSPSLQTLSTSHLPLM